jgi:iron-sulfur cluster protein
MDPYLQKILQSFARGYLLKREAAFQGHDFEALRSELAEIKDRTLDRLDECLALFEERARSRGSQVLRAKDGDEANGLILGILRKHGANKVAKGKSMVSEETGLNDFLVRQGITPRETDLGEWIVQLASERPSHMVMPAIHLTRKEVAALFSRTLGRAVPEDIASLVAVAREELRREIFATRAGLVGANALIAESGAAMVVTNEGNGRLVSTVPPVHIVLASIEKVLPRVEDALLLLKLLTRNATGQAITSYVSFIAGPHREAQYIILLDNRRSEMLRDRQFREILRCIKCAACLNVCPVYQMVGGSEFSHIYMGGIGSLLTAWIHGLKKSRDLTKLCLGCHRCEEYCATKIRIADLVVALKERQNDELGKALTKRMTFDGVMGNPSLHKALFGAGRAARPIVARRHGFARTLPRPLRRYDHFRWLPSPAAKPFSRQFRKMFGEKSADDKRGTPTLYAGCLVEHFYPEIGLSAARVLRKLGYNVVPGPAGCCGFPSANAGFSGAARRALKKILDGFTDSGAIITLCPTCATMLSRMAPQLIATEKAKRLAEKVIPFSEFLIRQETSKLGPLLRPDSFPFSVTYHDSCHHRHVLKAAEASRKLIRLAAGCEVTEMGGPAGCCGFAGSFSVDNPEISEALLKAKLEAIVQSGARVVALDCPGCLLQIRGGCHASNLGIQVKHTAELVAGLLK